MRRWGAVLGRLSAYDDTRWTETPGLGPGMHICILTITLILLTRRLILLASTCETKRDNKMYNPVTGELK